jgi:hypothetical protein
MMEIQALHAGLGARWDEFARAHRQGSPFHLTAWKNVIANIFGYKPMWVFRRS